MKRERNLCPEVRFYYKLLLSFRKRKKERGGGGGGRRKKISLRSMSFRRKSRKLSTVENVYRVVQMYTYSTRTLQTKIYFESSFPPLSPGRPTYYIARMTAESP